MRCRAILLVAFVTAALSGGCGSHDANPGPTSPVDLIIHGGPVLTMVNGGPRAEAVAVAGDRIVAVGTDQEIMARAGTGTRVIDLHGASLLPGFVDAHSHFFDQAGKAGESMETVSRLILSQGITTTAEMYVDPSLWPRLQQLQSDGRLGVRLSAYLAANNACGLSLGDWWRDISPTRTSGERLRVGGVKVYADGGACNQPAVSYEYVGTHSHGDLYFTPAELASLVQEIEAAGHQAAVHALGDRAIETALDAMAEVIGASGNPHRHRLEHSAATRPDLRDRHGKVGVVTTIFGPYQTCFLTQHDGNFNFRTPPEYLEWEWPWRDLLDRNPGAHFAWHEDFPVFGPSAGPVPSLYGLVTRKQVAADGSICEPTAAMAANAITVQEALELMTTGAAYALFRETEVGQIAPGFLADFAVLSQDPTAVPAQDLRNLNVQMTILGGAVAWCGNESLALCATKQPTVTASQGGRPNIAKDATVAASAELPDRPAAAAIDGDVGTSWSAGSHPPQWIRLDFAQPTMVASVALVVDQVPAGQTVHRVIGSIDGVSFELLSQLSGSTQTGQVLSVDLANPRLLRSIKVETTESPSWVAWSEIQVFGP